MNYGRSYIDFPKWIKNRKATINSKINDSNDNRFQFVMMITLNYEQTRRDPQKQKKPTPL